MAIINVSSNLVRSTLLEYDMNYLESLLFMAPFTLCFILSNVLFIDIGGVLEM